MEKKPDQEAADAEVFKVEDKRHWSVEDEDGGDAVPSEVTPQTPSIIDEYRQRSEAAESKLREYIEAYKGHQEEQDRFRERMLRDVDRRVELQFGELVQQLLETIDDLDLSLEHIDGVAEAAPLAEGVRMARERFLAALGRHGVRRLSLDGTPFDPNEAEALRVDAVADPNLDGKVTETLRPGYKLADRVVRAAHVAVGRLTRSES